MVGVKAANPKTTPDATKPPAPLTVMPQWHVEVKARAKVPSETPIIPPLPWGEEKVEEAMKPGKEWWTDPSSHQMASHVSSHQIGMDTCAGTAMNGGTPMRTTGRIATCVQTRPTAPTAVTITPKCGRTCRRGKPRRREPAAHLPPRHSRAVRVLRERALQRQASQLPVQRFHH